MQCYVYVIQRQQQCVQLLEYCSSLFFCVNNISLYIAAYPIVQMEKKDFKCESIIDYILTIISLCSLVITTIIMSISCYIYRFEIKIHLFEKLDWHPFDKTKNEENKEYDVYLLYCRNDEEWVINTLLVGLKHYGYRTCVPDRDFTVGASTAEEMSSAFSKTHRVLVVVSQSFIDDVNAMSDFYHAYEHDRSVTRGRFLVLIKLQNKINFGERQEIFKRYLSTNYFVPVKSRSFWSRLRYWLPSTRLQDIYGCTEVTSGEQQLPTEMTPLLS